MVFGAKFFILCICVLQLISFSSVYTQEPEWSYDDNAPNGPPNWHTLPGYQSCSGSNQSPINIDVSSTVQTGRLFFYNYDTYQTQSIELHNDGHTVELEFFYPTTSLNNIPYIRGGLMGTNNYKVKNIHFHWGSDSTKGSEHTINNKRFPMEVHLVHIKSNFNNISEASQQADGVSVIGSMFSISSSDNTYLTSLLNNINSVKFKDQKQNINKFNLYNLFADNYQYFYAYRGSLTTPPCTEGVIWNVFYNPAKISEKQMGIFRNLQKETQANDPNSDMPLVDNFRDLQPLNGRTVYWNKQY